MLSEPAGVGDRPAIAGGLSFRAVVAMSALGIVYRELAGLPPEDDAEQRELAARIRADDVLPGTLERVKAEVAARLLVASPRYLERYDR